MLQRYSKTEKDSLPGLLILLGFFLLLLVVSNVIGAAAMVSMNSLGMKELIGNMNVSIMKSPNGWWSLMVAQGIASFMTFVLAAYLYIKLVEREKLSFLNFEKAPSVLIFILVFLAQLAFSPINGYFQELNQQMKLPAALGNLERLFKSMEDSMAEVVKYLTIFDTNIKLIVAILVIAVIAGIGEELIFRGLVQRKLLKAFNNPHAAIWVSAIIFSAIHMQFYGFLPRMFLGALLGYFYYWSGNIWVPIAGHIFNNAVAIILVHLVNIKAVSPDIEKLDKVPMPALVGSVAVFGGLMYLLYSKTINKTEQIS
jgi:uncharacterized protein